jgi:hypothetical protein
MISSDIRTDDPNCEHKPPYRDIRHQHKHVRLQASQRLLLNGYVTTICPHIQSLFNLLKPSGNFTYHHV